MTIPTKIENATEKTVVDHATGLIDAKGQALGVRVTTRELDLVEVPSGEGGCAYADTPGRYYTARIQKTKNGKPYGATQPERFYSSESARATAIAKRLV